LTAVSLFVYTYVYVGINLSRSSGERSPEATPSRKECRSRRRVGLQNIYQYVPSRAHAFYPVRIRIARGSLSRESRLVKPPRYLAQTHARHFPESAEDADYEIHQGVNHFCLNLDFVRKHSLSPYSISHKFRKSRKI